MNKKEMTWRIRVYGIVQGVGFRPTVSRHATNHGIYGTVCNKGPYVEIYAQGTKEQIEGFLNSTERTSTEACGCFENKYREYHRRDNRTV